MKRILLVDDDPDLLQMLSASIRAAGYSVLLANTGAEALAQAKTQPDLIILDLVLPEVDGFTVCQTLRRDKSTAAIPIMMLTGLTSQLNRFAGLECGANDYVTKPITPDELIARVRQFLPSPNPSPVSRDNSRS
jgi:two-component system response regulator RpaA